jgi:hypothetical protein
MTFSAVIANTDTGLIPYTTKQLQECNILSMKPRKAPTLDKLITVLLQIAIKKKAGSDHSEAKGTQSELQILKSETRYTRKETSRTCLRELQHVLCTISLTRSKIASKTSERKTRVPNSLQTQPKKGMKKERHIIQKSSPTTFHEKTSTRTNKYRSKKKKEKSTGTMDQRNTPDRASLILQTRSQDLDPGRAQRGNLSRKQNRKPKK